MNFIPLYLPQYETIELESLRLSQIFAESFSTPAPGENETDVLLALEDAPTLKKYDELAGCEVIILSAGTHSDDLTRFLNINHVSYAQHKEGTCLMHAKCDTILVDPDEACPMQENENEVEVWNSIECGETKLWRYRAVEKLMKNMIDREFTDYEPPRLLFVIDTDIVFLNFKISIQDVYDDISHSRSGGQEGPDLELVVTNDASCSSSLYPINSGVWLLRVSDYNIRFCESVLKNYEGFHEKYDETNHFAAQWLKDQPVATHEVQKLGVPVEQIRRICRNKRTNKRKIYVESADGKAVVTRNTVMNSFYRSTYRDTSEFTWSWPDFAAHLCGMNGMQRIKVLQSLCKELPEEAREVTGLCVEGYNTVFDWKKSEHSLIVQLRKMKNDNSIKTEFLSKKESLSSTTFPQGGFGALRWIPLIIVAGALFSFVWTSWRRIKTHRVF